MPPKVSIQGFSSGGTACAVNCPPTQSVSSVIMTRKPVRAAANAAASDQVAVTFAATGYTITSVSRSGKTFTLTKNIGNTPPITRTCNNGCTTW